MANLSHWDFAEVFGHLEASALIAGIDPADIAENWKMTMPISRRMEECYLNARSVVANVKRQLGSEANFAEYLTPEDLLSAALMMRVSHPLSGSDKWLNDAKFFDFNEQKFARDELARWLSAIGVKSAYEFKLDRDEISQQSAQASSKPTPETPPAAEKPLSAKERNTLLTIIAVLCKEYKLDYTKPAKTAGLIQGMAEFMKISIGETTIENHLKKIPDALGTRTR